MFRLPPLPFFVLLSSSPPSLRPVFVPKDYMPYERPKRLTFHFQQQRNWLMLFAGLPPVYTPTRKIFRVSTMATTLTSLAVAPPVDLPLLPP